MKNKELNQLITLNKAPTVVDVRTGMEFGNGHIPGAIHAPTWKIMLRLANLPEDKNSELVVTCELGPRALIAQGLLKMYGYTKVTLLEGHMSAWRRAGLPQN